MAVRADEMVMQEPNVAMVAERARDHRQFVAWCLWAIGGPLRFHRVYLTRHPSPVSGPSGNTLGVISAIAGVTAVAAFIAGRRLRSRASLALGFGLSAVAWVCEGIALRRRFAEPSATQASLDAQRVALERSASH